MSKTPWWNRFWQQLRGRLGGRRPAALGSPPSGYETLSVPIAGVMFANQWQAVLAQRLREPVELRREPANTHDPNAVMVVARDGQRLGYIGKRLAAQLAPHMDAAGRPIAGLLTELISDLPGQAIGAKVSFHAPSAALRQAEQAAHNLRYFLDLSSSSAAYLMVDCDEALLGQVMQRLGEAGLSAVRCGVSFRPASNGHDYHWYIVLEPGVTRAAIEQFFRERFPSAQPDDESGRLEEWIGQFDAEIRARQDEIAALRAENDGLKQALRQTQAATGQQTEQLELRVLELQANLERVERELVTAENKRVHAEQRLRQAQREDVLQVVAVLLPNVQFVRDSEDVLLRELADRRPLLGILLGISTGVQAPMKKVRSTNGWNEMHYNTGQHDDGRLYFSRVDGGKWQVLISYKGGQVRDMNYLQNC